MSVVICNAFWWRRHCIGISYEGCVAIVHSVADNGDAVPLAVRGRSDIDLRNSYACHTPPTRWCLSFGGDKDGAALAIARGSDAISLVRRVAI
jgi:hypothetical protein